MLQYCVFELGMGFRSELGFALRYRTIVSGGGFHILFLQQLLNRFVKNINGIVV